jgi:hypothetical protein
MWMMRPAALMLALCLVATGCNRKEPKVSNYPDVPMLGAVMNSRTEKVRELAAKGIGLNERAPEDNATPMIRGAQTDQWPVVEILIDHGADIWAHDEFGITAAQRTITSRILRGSDEDKARLRVIEKLKARGYPFPPPGRDEILALEKAGKWPPVDARR